jgi:cell division protein ZapE
MHSGYGSATPASVRDAYRHRVEKGEFDRDLNQEEIAASLDRLISAIQTKRLASKSSALGWLFARKRDATPVRGLYLHGGVGTGKTMLMDLFFHFVPVTRKRRAHFHEFMTDVHDRIARHRQAVKSGEAKGDDPIPPVAKALAAEAWVLCFDEFSVTDIADAMILSRLFSALFAEGVVLVATSNVAPDDLYRDGLNRALFQPFIAILKRNVEVKFLDSGKDYRLEKLGKLPVYVTPLGPGAEAKMDEIWVAATQGHQEAPVELAIKGRRVTVSRAADGAARFTFSELCERPLAAREYLAIAARFTAIFIDNVPVLDPTRRSAAKRFILLIDTLYDQGVHLVVSAAAPPHELYAGRPGTEQFEFQRTASRLIEMQGVEWRQGSTSYPGDLSDGMISARSN